MARTGLKNKTKLKYALFLGKQPLYLIDDNGDFVLDEDGKPIPTGSKANTYDAPVPFNGTLSFAGGEAEAKSYGISVDGYDSKLLMLNGELPISETSLLFYGDTEPKYKPDGTMDEMSADFRVVKVAPSKLYKVYLLKRIEK